MLNRHRREEKSASADEKRMRARISESPKASFSLRQKNYMACAAGGDKAAWHTRIRQPMRSSSADAEYLHCRRAPFRRTSPSRAASRQSLAGLVVQFKSGEIHRRGRDAVRSDGARGSDRVAALRSFFIGRVPTIYARRAVCPFSPLPRSCRASRRTYRVLFWCGRGELHVLIILLLLLQSGDGRARW